MVTKRIVFRLRISQRVILNIMKWSQMTYLKKGNDRKQIAQRRIAYALLFLEIRFGWKFPKTRLEIWRHRHCDLNSMRRI